MQISLGWYNSVIGLFPKWHELNLQIKKIYPRGINLHEIFTEIIVCWHFKYDLNIGSGTDSADAIDLNGLKIQIKGSSSCENDLTSFGPKSKFDLLIFACINQTKYIMKIYKINVNHLNNIMVNKKQSFKDVQKLGKRPRFSINKKIIKPNNLKPTKIIDLRKKI